MAVVTGPLMSLTASGTIANTITYGDWKGIKYARTRVIPANPQSVEQTKTRTVFSYLNDLYKFFPGIAREPWLASVAGIPMTAQNMIASKNVSVLRDATDLTDLVLSPGARGGSPPTDIITTPGAGSLTVAVSVPTPPTGWTLTGAQGVVVQDQDPHEVIAGQPVAAEDLTSTYSLVFSGLDATTDYQIGVWLKWLTLSQDTAYSIALRDIATTT
jgi:hypothetical protein